MNIPDGVEGIGLAFVVIQLFEEREGHQFLSTGLLVVAELDNGSGRGYTGFGLSRPDASGSPQPTAPASPPRSPDGDRQCVAPMPLG